MDFQPAGCPRHQSAFTLVELMITLTVAIIVLSVAIPSYRTVAAGSITTAVNTMAAHLHLARSEAIKRGIQVILCPSTDGKTCLDGFEWQEGFMIYADVNENRKPDEKDRMLRFHQPDRRRIRILTSTGRKKLIYKPSGMSPGSTATITVCDTTGYTKPRAIIVSNTGRPRLSDTHPDGGPLRCG